MTLLELQRRMEHDVTRPLTEDFSMQSEAEDGSSIAQIAEGYIKSNDRLSSFERLEIYNRQYWFRVIGAVAKDFAALRAVMGNKRFNALVLAYLRENPSTSFTLRNLGAKLPKWVEAHPAFSPRRRLLALDVARLEWAYIEAYDGSALPPMNESDFARLTPESALSLQPHLQLLALRYPVDELVMAVHKANPSVDILSNAVSGSRQRKRVPLPSMRRAATYLVVHRVENSVYYRRLDHEAYLILAAFQSQRSLSEAIETAFANSILSAEEQSERIRQYFSHFAELGWFYRHSKGQMNS